MGGVSYQSINMNDPAGFARDYAQRCQIQRPFTERSFQSTAQLQSQVVTTTTLKDGRSICRTEKCEGKWLFSF